MLVYNIFTLTHPASFCPRTTTESPFLRAISSLFSGLNEYKAFLIGAI